MQSMKSPISLSPAKTVLWLGCMMAAVLFTSAIAYPADRGVRAQEKQRNFENPEQLEVNITNEERAGFGSIFVGRVDRVIGEFKKEFVVGEFERVIDYEVTVQTVLNGNLEGQVVVRYFHADVTGFPTGGFGPLEIGSEYLLFAGKDFSDPNNVFYPVIAGKGTILITGKAQQQQLVRKFTVLIAAAQKAAKQARAESDAYNAIWERARSQRRGAPTVSMNPAAGPAGTVVTVSGANFGYELAVVVQGGPDLNDTHVALADVNPADGTFSVEIKIPKGTGAGSYPIEVNDDHGFAETLEFTVER